MTDIGIGIGSPVLAPRRRFMLLRRLLAHRSFQIGAVLLILLTAAAILAPLTGIDPSSMKVRFRYKPPSAPSFLVRDILAERRREEWIVRRALESMRPGKDWLNGTLGRATMPVLIVWGKQDTLIPVAYAAPLASELAHATLTVLDGCGHVPMADCPEAFDRELTAFLGASAP